MLFTQSTFENFTGNKISDSNQGTEVLFSIGAETREEVDEMAEKVVNAGGTIYSEAEDKNQAYTVKYYIYDIYKRSKIFKVIRAFCFIFIS